MKIEDLIHPPDETLGEFIKKEINEIDDGKLEHNIKLFEQWVECQPHLPKNYKKHMLQTYLRGTKHDLEQAKQKFEIYFVGRNRIQPIFDHKLYTSEELKIVENFAVFAMPDLSQDGYRVSILKVLVPDADLFDIKLIINNSWRMAHLRMCTEQLFGGDVYVIDCQHITAAMIPKLLTKEFKEAMFLTQESFSSRIRRMHLINAPSYMEKVVIVLKLIVNEKLKKRIYVDKGMSSILECIHKKSLPKDYGGDGESIDVVFAKWMRYCDENKDWYAGQNEVRATGPVPKHLIACLGSENDFGVAGSFRKLVID